MSAIDARATPEHGVELARETAPEADGVGFNVDPSSDLDGSSHNLDAALIPAEGGAATGARYTYAGSRARACTT